MKDFLKSFSDFIKLGMIFGVVLCALFGYAFAWTNQAKLEYSHLIIFLYGIACLGAGIFSLNQVQEHKLDAQMDRTKTRPIPAGKISVRYGLTVSIAFILFSLVILYLLNPMLGFLGFFTFLTYNIFYTYYWKPRSPFGAVPGAIPGAMPVVLGYVAGGGALFSKECLYLFLVMFVWQMPHFWALTLKLKDDYQKGNIPVLPAVLGIDRTLYHIGLYLFLYIGIGIAAPWFIPVKYAYLLIVIPLSLKLLFEFKKLFQAEGKTWFPFFMWVNFSLLGFLFFPIVDKFWILLKVPPYFW